jgi:hypothetical protein
VLDPVELPPVSLSLRPSAEAASFALLHALNRLSVATINGAAFSAFENFIDPHPCATAVLLHAFGG